MYLPSEQCVSFMRSLMSCKVVAYNSGIREFQAANRTRYYQIECVIGVHCATMSFKAMKLVILLA